MELATIKNVKRILPELSDTSASRAIRYARDVLDKQKPKIITMEDFCKCHDLNYKETVVASKRIPITNFERRNN